MPIAHDTHVAQPPAALASSPIDWSEQDLTDEALVAKLPGFRNGHADVEGCRIHFVEGGAGRPLVLLSGWPQTWWSWQRILPTLASEHRLIAIDLRGQGSSARPETGYDKKTLAGDVLAVAQGLGYERFDIAGHDIGSMVAYSLAANYPQAVRRLAMLEIPHPSADGLGRIPLLPQAGDYDLGNPGHGLHPWWLAFNQIPELPERLLAGRTDILLDWVFDYLSRTSKAVTPFDRAVYKAAARATGAIRAGNGYYRAFRHDMRDLETYDVLQMPVLGLAGDNFHILEAFVTRYSRTCQLHELSGAGHWLVEERPAETADVLKKFFQAAP